MAWTRGARSAHYVEEVTRERFCRPALPPFPERLFGLLGPLEEHILVHPPRFRRVAREERGADVGEARVLITTSRFIPY